MVYDILREGIIVYSLQATTNKITYIKHKLASTGRSSRKDFAYGCELAVLEPLFQVRFRFRNVIKSESVLH
jgi:hypothetical protein